MKRNKKALIILVISIIAVLVVGTVTTTYAWFLSRYAAEYDFVLNSQSPMILKYETDLSFESDTTIASPENILIPATEKRATSGIGQGALTPLSVFDVDTISPAHSGVVQRAAQAVKYTATGAFWTGEEDNSSAFTPILHVYTNDFLGSTALSTHLASMADQDETLTVTESTLLDIISREEIRKTAPDRLLARNDLVARGEIDYIMVIEYSGISFLYYDGAYYVQGVESGSAFTLPAEAESNSELRYWHTPTAENCTVRGEQLSDGSYFHLLPNTTFSFTLYVFVAKTDEKLDPEINGQRLTLFMSLTATEVVAAQQEPAEPEEP